MLELYERLIEQYVEEENLGIVIALNDVACQETGRWSLT